MRGHRRRIALLALAAATALGACREVAPKVTGVRITAKPKNAFAFEQIAFGIEDPLGNQVIAPLTRPPDGGTTLAGQQDFVIYLDDAKANTDVVCKAAAFHNQSQVASGKSPSYKLLLQRILDCDVLLVGAGGADAGGTDGGGSETSGPDAAAMDAPDAATHDAPDAPDAGITDKPDAGGDTPPDQQMGTDSLIDLGLPDLGLPELL